MADIILLRDWMDSQVEFWLPTQYEGYDISSFGRVRSYIGIKNFGRGYERVWFAEPHILKLAPSTNGGLQIGVGRNTKNEKVAKSVYRLVALAFVANPLGLPEVNHLNAVREDGRVGNLEWTTRRANVDHAIRIGLIGQTGEANPNARLTNAEREDIKRLCVEGIKRVVLAARYGVTPARIGQIARSS